MYGPELIHQVVFVLIIFVEGGPVDHGLLAQLIHCELLQRRLFQTLQQRPLNLGQGFDHP